MKKTSLSPSGFLFIISLLFIANSAFSAAIKGRVKDGKTNETLIGATIYLKEDTKINTSAGLDGSYLLKNVQPGTYTLMVDFFGYASQQRKITIANATDEITEDFGMKPDSLTLQQVQVYGQANQGSDNYARSEEKNSDVVMNIMSAKTIQLLPDYTIGDVLQRVSGVTTQKSVTGGGKFATIRGMDARYNYTTIDGVKVPSPDYKNSYVPMDIFPSEMVERLEVIKTLTPDMEGDAIGGAMNLVLKEAPDNFTLSAEAATGFNQNLYNHGFQTFNTSVINSQSPNQANGSTYNAQAPADFPVAATTIKNESAPPDIFAGFTIGDRFFGGRFGVLASFTYQNTYSYTTGFFISPQSQPNASLTQSNIPIWDYIESREDYVKQTRGGGHVMMDYVFNRKNKITLYNVYAEMTQVEMRITDDTDNAVRGSSLDPGQRFETTYEHIYNVTLKGTDTLAHNLALDWTTAYARAWSVIPDWNDLSLDGYFGSSVIDFGGLTTRWIDNTEQDFSGYANLTYSFPLFGQDIEVKGGAMNRDKSRDAYYAKYDFSTAPPPNQEVYTGMSEIFSNPNYYGFFDRTGSPGSANSYNVQQDITAYYGMLKFSLGPRIQILGGARMENTNEAYQTQESIQIPAAYGTIQYNNLLPSAEIKFKITDKQSLQASYFASLARPSLYDIIPYQLPGDYYTEVGNPELLATQANNYDLRYEFFPSASEEVMAGVFYKQIYNAIEDAIIRGAGPSSIQLKPTNIGGDTNPAINYGFEFQFIKYIHNFGVVANYTYTHSSITVPEQLYNDNPALGGFNTKVVSESRPLQGQADDIANLSLIYKAPKIGLEMQVSGVYTGKEISAVSIWYEMNLWQMPTTTLAFSFEKRLSKKIKLSLYGKINNILNTPMLIEMFPPNEYLNSTKGANLQNWLPNQTNSEGYINSITVEKELYGQSYLMGIRYKF